MKMLCLRSFALIIILNKLFNWLKRDNCEMFDYIGKYLKAFISRLFLKGTNQLFKFLSF